MISFRYQYAIKMISLENQDIQKIIRFTSSQIKLGEEIALPLGMTFNSWVKYLVLKELEAFSKANPKKLNNENENTSTDQTGTQEDSKEIKDEPENRKILRKYLRIAGMEEIMDKLGDYEESDDIDLPY